MTRIFDDVILVDGPAAGLTAAVGQRTGTYCVLDVPQPIPLTREPEAPPPREALGTTYTICSLRRADPGMPQPLAVRVGYSGPELSLDDVDEHLLTVLALHDAVAWDVVPATQLDETSPLHAAGGDPTLECRPHLEEYIASELRGYCSCGWLTDVCGPSRRSQLARATRRHLLEMENLRLTEDLAIRIVAAGTGPSASCLPLITLPMPQPRQKTASTVPGRSRFVRPLDGPGWAHAHCPGCGWQTTRVPPAANRKLIALCDEHVAVALEACRDEPNHTELLALLEPANRRQMPPGTAEQRDASTASSSEASQVSASASRPAPAAEPRPAIDD